MLQKPLIILHTHCILLLLLCTGGQSTSTSSTTQQTQGGNTVSNTDGQVTKKDSPVTDISKEASTLTTLLPEPTDEIITSEDIRYEDDSVTLKEDELTTFFLQNEPTKRNEITNSDNGGDVSSSTSTTSTTVTSQTSTQESTAPTKETTRTRQSNSPSSSTFTPNSITASHSTLTTNTNSSSAVLKTSSVPTSILTPSSKRTRQTPTTRTTTLQPTDPVPSSTTIQKISTTDFLFTPKTTVKKDQTTSKQKKRKTKEMGRKATSKDEEAIGPKKRLKNKQQVSPQPLRGAVDDSSAAQAANKKSNSNTTTKKKRVNKNKMKKQGPPGPRGPPGPKGDPGPPGNCTCLADDPGPPLRLQAAVSAVLTTHFGPDKDVIIPFDLELIDLADNYDNVSGVFFCSIPGTYVISVYLMSHPGSKVNARVFVNSRPVAALWADDNKDGGFYPSSSIQTISKLEFGDQVYVMLVDGGYGESWVHANYNVFTVFLLYEDFFAM